MSRSTLNPHSRASGSCALLLTILGPTGGQSLFITDKNIAKTVERQTVAGKIMPTLEQVSYPILSVSIGLHVSSIR